MKHYPVGLFASRVKVTKVLKVFPKPGDNSVRHIIMVSLELIRFTESSS